MGQYRGVFCSCYRYTWRDNFYCFYNWGHTNLNQILNTGVYHNIECWTSKVHIQPWQHIPQTHQLTAMISATGTLNFIGSVCSSHSKQKAKLFLMFHGNEQQDYCPALKCCTKESFHYFQTVMNVVVMWRKHFPFKENVLLSALL